MTELESLRKKEVSWGIWQSDALERIRQLESDLKDAQHDRDKYQQALRMIQAGAEVIAKTAMLSAHEISSDDFARDFAPFINVMAYHGVDGYAKKKRSRK